MINAGSHKNLIEQNPNLNNTGDMNFYSPFLSSGIDSLNNSFLRLDESKSNAAAIFSNTAN
jgi:hypothetical protein